MCSDVMSGLLILVARRTTDYKTDWKLNIDRGPHGVGHASSTLNVTQHTQKNSKKQFHHDFLHNYKGITTFALYKIHYTAS